MEHHRVVGERWWRGVEKGRIGVLVEVQWWMQASTCNRVVHHAGWRTQMHPVHVHPLLPSCTQPSLSLSYLLLRMQKGISALEKPLQHLSVDICTGQRVGPAARHSLTMNRSTAGLRISRSQSF